MDILKENFPDIPDYILLSFLAASGRNIERTKQNIRRAVDTNQIAHIISRNRLPVPRENVPKKQEEPIYIDSSESDSDDLNEVWGWRFPQRQHIIWRPNPPPREIFAPEIPVQQVVQPPPSIPHKTTVINGITYSIPIIPQQALKLIENAIKVAPDMDYSRASAYLEMVIQTDKYPDDIVDRLLLAAGDPRQNPSTSYMKDSLTVLQNVFCNLTITSLRKLLSSMKRIVPIIDKLTREPPTQVMKTPRKRITLIRIQDLFVTYELGILEKRETDKREKEERERREEREIEEARENGSLIECGCCFCEVPIDRCLQCPEGHLFCRDCVQKMIETTISEGRSTVKCPAMDGCGMDIPMSELERMIPEKTLQRLFQTEAMNDIVRSGLEHIVKCFDCGFMVEFIGEGNMRCPQCGKETCSKCGLEAHPKMTCEQAKERDPDKLIEEKMNDAVIRVCPNCHTPFTKDEGCNKMVCPRCGTWICYWCRKVIPKEVGYEHFWRQPGPCPPDRCPLWVENKQLHEIEAAKAKLDAKGELNE